MHADEKAFQRALTARPYNHTVRLVFADWLQERDDPRAVGYRVLGLWGRYPLRERTYWTYTFNSDKTWFSYVGGRVGRLNGKPYTQSPYALPLTWFHEVRYEPGDKTKHARRHLEDATALAFNELPAELADRLRRGP